MHFTGTVYRNPYWPTWPLLEITQGCTHNKCKFCTMYKDVPFKMSPMEWIEEDLKERPGRFSFFRQIHWRFRMKGSSRSLW